MTVAEAYETIDDQIMKEKDPKDEKNLKASSENLKGGDGFCTLECKTCNAG